MKILRITKKEGFRPIPIFDEQKKEPSKNPVKDFLQGQLTINLDKVKPGEYFLAAHCNPKGRMESLFHITKIKDINNDNNDCYELIMPEDIINYAKAKLEFYAKFSPVKMEIIEAEEKEEEGKEIINNNLDLNFNNRFMQIKNKTPYLTSKTVGIFLPSDLNLESYGAVDFDKGCFTGQEVIARMHYLGKAKKSCVFVNIKSFESLNNLNNSDELDILDHMHGENIYLDESMTQKAGEIICIAMEKGSDSMAAILSIQNKFLENIGDVFVKGFKFGVDIGL